MTTQARQGRHWAAWDRVPISAIELYATILLLKTIAKQQTSNQTTITTTLKTENVGNTYNIMNYNGAPDCLSDTFGREAEGTCKPEPQPLCKLPRLGQTALAFLAS